MMTTSIEAASQSYWVVDGTGITVVTDDDVVLAKIRREIALVGSALKLPDGVSCTHWTNSFFGVSGTAVCAKSWIVHVPSRVDGGLWDAVEMASTADWTEIDKHTLG